MEFPREKVNSGAQQRSSSTLEWSEEFQCYTVNGTLCPFPLSAIPMEDVTDNEQKESASSSQEESNKKKKTETHTKYFFKLFKFPNAIEQYLLEIHEVETGSVVRHHVIAAESNGRWKVGIHDLGTGDHVVVPVLQDTNPPVFPKSYQLPLEERLFGWTVEKRKRGNGKEDKFYYHQVKQFRSFVEVATFIIYSCKAKDLQIMNKDTIAQ